MTGIQHSADNSDDFYIESTEAPINAFKHQVILQEGPDKVTITNPFSSYTRINISTLNTNDDYLLQVLKNHFDLSKVNGLLTTEPLMGKIQEIYKTHFGCKRMLKIRFCQTMLQDVPQEDEQWNIIRREHYRAHRGAEENKLQLLRRFYFPKLSQKLKDFVTNCQICHESKYNRNPIKYPIQATPIPNAPFKIAHIDILFLENHHFLTYIDKFSKFAQIKTIDSRAAVDIVPAVKEILSKYNTPEILVMDGEKSFMTGDLVNFYNTHHIQPYITATGRSEMNGVVERFHSTILEIYRMTKAENPGKPVNEMLLLSLNKYNSSIHSTTKHTPLEIILPSPRTPEIIEKVFKNITEKQKKDLKYHNK